jgi:hypothetical protein
MTYRSILVGQHHSKSAMGLKPGFGGARPFTSPFTRDPGAELPACTAYFPGTGSQPRVTKSLRLSNSRIPSHSMPPPTTTLVRMVL